MLLLPLGGGRRENFFHPRRAKERKKSFFSPDPLKRATAVHETLAKPPQHLSEYFSSKKKGNPKQSSSELPLLPLPQMAETSEQRTPLTRSRARKSSTPPPDGVKTALDEAIQQSRKRIKTKALARKFAMLGEAVFDCGGLAKEAKRMLETMVERARKATLKHLVTIYRAQQQELEIYKDKAGLRECCICQAVDDAPIRRLAEEDATIAGFVCLGDLPSPSSYHQSCICDKAYLCPTCFGRQRISVISRQARIYDMVRCPLCRAERLFETRQVNAAIDRCDTRIVDRRASGLDDFPILIRVPGETVPFPSASAEPCRCNRPATPPRSPPHSPRYDDDYEDD